MSMRQILVQAGQFNFSFTVCKYRFQQRDVEGQNT